MRRGSAVQRLGTLCLAALAACAAPRLSSTSAAPPLAAEVRGPDLLLELQYGRADEAEAARVGNGLLAAAPRLARWGAFRQGISVRILPDHESLEAALGRRGYPWLRAWAFGDRILLQSPRTWGETPGAAQEELSELLAHELTHALMYQLLQPLQGGVSEEPPLWFREGMASVTAGQGHRRLGAADLRRWQDGHPGADLLRPGTELYRTEKEAVYGAAHRAFELLVELSGDRGVREVLRGVRAGACFSDSFAAVTGRSLASFEGEAVRSGFSASAFQGPSGAGGP